MKLKNKAIMLMILALGSGFWACKDKDEEPLDYDRSVLLQNTTNGYILPSYEALEYFVDSLNTAATAFAASPSAAELDVLQASLRTAWTAWVRCSPLGFGPASNLNLRTALNTFPSDPAQIESNVMAGTWDLNSASNVDARGFPALDYLLHHTDDASLVTEFTTATDAANRVALLQALTADILDLVSQVYDQWSPSGGNFAATFTASLGTDAGSSTSALVNQLNFDLEQLKNARLGIPLGKKSLGQILPEKVECYYGGYSSSLAQAQLSAISRLYLGAAFATGTDNYGLQEALIALEADYNGTSLADAIRGQFDLASAAVGALPEPLSDAIQNNNTAPVESAYNEVQKLVVLLKTDMPSAMGILITYTDNDGD